MTRVNNNFTGPIGQRLLESTSNAGGTPLSVVNPPNTDAAVYTDERVNPVTGGTVAKLHGAGANPVQTISEVRFVRPAAVRGAIKWIAQFAGTAPEGTTVVSQIRPGTGVQTTNSTLATNATMGAATGGTTIGSTALSPAVPLSPTGPGTWVVGDEWVEQGTTATNGQYRRRIRTITANPDGSFGYGTTLQDYTMPAGRSTGVQGTDAAPTDYRFGDFTTTTTLGPIYVAWLDADDGATTFLPDPALFVPATPGAALPELYAYETGDGFEGVELFARDGSAWVQITALATVDPADLIPNPVTAAESYPGRVTVTWTSVPTADQYNVWQVGVAQPLAIVPAPATSWTSALGAFPAGTVGQFYVTAVAGGVESLKSSTQSVTFTAPLPNPTTPQGVHVVSTGNGTVTIGWTLNSGDSTNAYRQRRGAPGTALATVGQVGPDVATFTHTGLVNGQQYAFQVQARNTITGAQSQNSVEVVATAGVPVAALESFMPLWGVYYAKDAAATAATDGTSTLLVDSLPAAALTPSAPAATSTTTRPSLVTLDGEKYIHFGGGNRLSTPTTNLAQSRPSMSLAVRERVQPGAGSGMREFAFGLIPTVNQNRFTAGLSDGVPRIGGRRLTSDPSVSKPATAAGDVRSTADRTVIYVWDYANATCRVYVDGVNVFTDVFQTAGTSGNNPLSLHLGATSATAEGLVGDVHTWAFLDGAVTDAQAPELHRTLMGGKMPAPVVTTTPGTPTPTTVSWTYAVSPASSIQHTLRTSVGGTVLKTYSADPGVSHTVTYTDLPAGTVPTTYAWDAQFISTEGGTVTVSGTVTTPATTTTTPPTGGGTGGSTGGGTGTGTLLPKPPALTSPITVTLTNSDRSIVLDQTKDYIINAPNVLTGPVTIDGGRNVRWVGGEIRADQTWDKPMLYFIRTAGSAWAEGIKIGGAYQQEGVNVHCGMASAPADIWIVNCDLGKASGQYSAWHGDLFQCYGLNAGHKCHLERVVGDTDYQGIMWQPGMYGTSVDTRLELNHVYFNKDPNTESYVFFGGNNSTVFDFNDVHAVTSQPYPFYPDSRRPAGITTYTTAPDPEPSILTGTPGLGYVSPGYVA